ncbi:GGDEF domain-containing protein [Deinococcus puniceus]|nr:GGDEF domain-containing protein [Deinococcus puniceus]
MTRPSTLLENQLLRTRQLVLQLVAVGYLIFTIGSSFVAPPGVFPEAYQYSKYWADLICLGALVALYLAPRRVFQIAVVCAACVAGLAGLEMYRLLQHDLPPYEPALWMTCVCIVAFVLMGSRWGSVFTGVALLIVLIFLLLIPPSTPQLTAAWLAGMTVVGVISGVCYRVTRFIESNLVMHEEDHAKLNKARLDSLTELPGRAAIEEELNRKLEYARKTGTPLSLLVGDIDHFKTVNDHHGHNTGDDVLRAVAKRLRRNVGGTGGVVGRWGGEEFVVLLPGLAKPDALVLADRLRREIGGSELAGLSITTSFGVASYRGPHDTANQLFGRADQALYEAKRAGRNSVR